MRLRQIWQGGFIVGVFEVLVRRFGPPPGFYILSFSAPALPQMGNPFYRLISPGPFYRFISPGPFPTKSQQRRRGLFSQSHVPTTERGLWMKSPYKPTTTPPNGMLGDPPSCLVATTILHASTFCFRLIDLWPCVFKELCTVSPLHTEEFHLEWWDWMPWS